MTPTLSGCWAAVVSDLGSTRPLRSWFYPTRVEALPKKMPLTNLCNQITCYEHPRTVRLSGVSFRVLIDQTGRTSELAHEPLTDAGTSFPIPQPQVATRLTSREPALVLRLRREAPPWGGEPALAPKRVPRSRGVVSHVLGESMNL
jgi:hypothetical protein